MRKILLGTTGVVGAALIGMGVAQAQEAPQVRIGGYFDFSMGYIDDSADSNRVTTSSGTADRDKVDFRSDAEIYVFVTGKAANGMSYGATIELQVDNVGGSSAGTGVDTDEMYMFVSTPTLGRLVLGDEDNAANLMQVRAAPIYASGGAGRWADFVQASGGPRYLITSINDGNDATKIIYTSPQFFGFDFGVSFAPNGSEGERELAGTGAAPPATGASSNTMQRDRQNIRNELSAAARYRGSFGNVGVALGIAGQWAEAGANAPAGTDDINAYAVGANVSFAGLTLGAEYVWGKYSGTSPGRAPARPGGGDSSHWALGAVYTMGAWQFGAFYGQAEQDSAVSGGDLEQTVWGLGFNYVLAPGMNIFGNYTSVEDSNRTPIGNPARTSRDIDAFIIGTAVAF